MTRSCHTLHSPVHRRSVVHLGQFRPPRSHAQTYSFDVASHHAPAAIIEADGVLHAGLSLWRVVKVVSAVLMLKLEDLRVCSIWRVSGGFAPKDAPKSTLLRSGPAQMVRFVLVNAAEVCREDLDRRR
jgi:hypothetical protein